MQAPLLVAVAQPRCAAKATHSNARAHAELIRSARARVVIFPELSLTGYELDADPIAIDDWSPSLTASAFSVARSEPTSWLATGLP
jgi:predicted amidohydrolase